MSWIRTWVDSVMVAVRVVGGLDESAGGDWWARIRFVVEFRGMDFVSRMGSAVSSSSSASSSESESSLSRSIRLNPPSFITMSSFSFSRPASACVPATAYTVAGYALRLSPRLSRTMSKERQGHVVVKVCSISYVDGSGANVSPAASLLRPGMKVC